MFVRTSPVKVFAHKSQYTIWCLDLVHPPRQTNLCHATIHKVTFSCHFEVEEETVSTLFWKCTLSCRIGKRRVDKHCDKRSAIDAKRTPGAMPDFRWSCNGSVTRRREVFTSNLEVFRNCLERQLGNRSNNTMLRVGGVLETYRRSIRSSRSTIAP